MLRLIAILTVLVPAMALSAPDASAAKCHLSITVLSRGFGQPDDVAVRRHRIYFSDIGSGVVGTVQHGRPVRLISHLRVPEGIDPESHSRLVVAEQGTDRIVLFKLNGHRRHLLLQLHNNTGREGVDGIGTAPHGGIYVPDSPNARLLLSSRKGRVKLLAEHLGRPVDAVRYRGGVAVPDETSGVVWLIKHGKTKRLARVPTPDDVVAIKRELIATTLDDGGLWEIRPRLQRLPATFGQPQGLAAVGSHALLVADSSRDRIYRIRGLGNCM